MSCGAPDGRSGAFCVQPGFRQFPARTCEILHSAPLPADTISCFQENTVGGSIYGRFGFSDVLTAFLAMDTFVELYNGGTVRLSDFVNRKQDKDLLLSVIVRKGKRQFRYESIRQTQTDFPVLACATVTGIVHGQETWYFSIGARPMKAALLEKKWEIPRDASEERIREYAQEVASSFTYGTNMRGSAEYRQHLAEVLVRREISSILAEER